MKIKTWTAVLLLAPSLCFSLAAKADCAIEFSKSIAYKLCSESIPADKYNRPSLKPMTLAQAKKLNGIRILAEQDGCYLDLMCRGPVTNTRMNMYDLAKAQAYRNVLLVPKHQVRNLMSIDGMIVPIWWTEYRKQDIQN